MHAGFWLYGDKDQCDTWLKWMSTRIMMLPHTNEKGKKFEQPIALQLRYSIFGMYELVFPEQHKDVILTTLGFHKPVHPNTAKMRWFLRAARLAIGYKKPGKFDSSRALVLPDSTIWCSVIPIGVREDDVRFFEEGIGGNKVVEEAL